MSSHNNNNNNNGGGGSRGRGKGGGYGGGKVDRAIVSGPTLSLLISAFGVRSTPYTVLRCSPSSTPAELRRAYRAAAMLHHPDRFLLLRHRCRCHHRRCAEEAADDEDE